MKTTRMMVLIAGLVGLLIVTGCATSTSAAPTPEGDPAPGTWVDVTISGDVATLPFSVVEEHVNTHFSLRADGRELAFMAYLLNDTLHVRANACPPCRSRGFTLVGNVLDCDACHTTFSAIDGSGIAGPCVDYPKEAVSTRIVEGAISMSLAELVAAYDATLVAGW